MNIRMVKTFLISLMVCLFFQVQAEETEVMKSKSQNIIAEANLIKGQDFLAMNKKKKGIVVRESGLQYEILKKGIGKKPRIIDRVEVHYHGTLINGQVFDSSIDRGQSITFPVRNVIRGWAEALMQMPEGSKWMLYIPSNLAYGEQGAGALIGPNETLIFEVELIKIK